MFEIRWSQGEKQSRIYQKVGFLVNPEGPSIPGSSLSAVLGLTWSRMGLLLQPKGLSCREEFAPQDGRFPQSQLLVAGLGVMRGFHLLESELSKLR